MEASTITVSCPFRHPFQVSRELCGQVVNCPQCQGNVVVADPQADQEPYELTALPVAKPRKVPQRSDARLRPTPGERPPDSIELGIAVLAYLPVLGWVFATAWYFGYRRRSSFIAFHLRQAIGVSICLLLGMMGVLIAERLGVSARETVGLAAGVAAMWVLIWLNAMFAAWQREQEEVPIIGWVFQIAFARLR